LAVLTDFFEDLKKFGFANLMETEEFLRKLVSIVNYLLNLVYEEKQNADLYIEISEVMIKFSECASDNAVHFLFIELFEKLTAVFRNEECDSVFFEEVYGFTGDLINNHPILLSTVFEKFNKQNAFLEMLTGGFHF
jgi:hypothetical protein